MSRPPNPSWTVPTWAPDANYPVGVDNWSGLPTKVAHPGAASVGFTPKTGVAAQCQNQNFSDAFATDAAAKAFLQTFLDAVAQGPAMSFSASVTVPVVSRARFSPALHMWIAGCGTGNDLMLRTADPFHWPSTTEVPSPQRQGLPLSDFDVATDGSIVAPIDGAGQALLECSAAGTWTARLGVLSNDLDKPSVAYAPTAALWCVAGHTSGGGQTVCTSPDRVTWTLRTPPTGIPSTAMLTLSSDGAGVLVMQAHDPAGTSTYFSKSTDGGFTWSAASTHALGFTLTALNDYSRPVWNGQVWIAVEGDSVTKHSKVYSSPDGATWTQVAALTTVHIPWIAANAELIVGIANHASGSSQVVFSVDRGVTWRFSDRLFTGGVVGVYGNGERFFAFGGSGSGYVSSGNGLGVSIAT